MKSASSASSENAKGQRADLERWFQELLTAHGPSLGRLAASYTRGTAERDDLVQEIALAILMAPRRQLEG